MTASLTPSISLFSGAGGLDLGLERAGLRFRAWVEVDEDCRETLRRNFEVPEGSLFADITSVDPEQLLRVCGVGRGEVFVVAGGPPCQAFSTAGRRLSMQDPRGALVEKYFDIIAAVLPRFFVFENVRGLLSAAVVHRPLAQRGPSSEPLREVETLGSLFRLVIRPRFEALGYEVVAGLVDAADYGVPQHRTRVIILGSREGEFGSDAFARKAGRPLSIHDLMPPTHTRVTLRQALALLRQDEPPEYIPYSPARERIFRAIPPGHNWRYIRDNPHLFPRDFLKEAMGGALYSTGGRAGFWRRLSYDEPSPTLTTSPVQLATGLCHPEETRPLSVQEYLRVQDFPVD